MHTIYNLWTFIFLKITVINSSKQTVKIIIIMNEKNQNVNAVIKIIHSSIRDLVF